MISTSRKLGQIQKIVSIDAANTTINVANIVAGSIYTSANGIVFPDGTRQTTAGVAVDAWARDTANTAYDNTIQLQNIDATQNNNITHIGGIAQGAFDEANTASGNITIIQGVNTTQNTNIVNAENLAQGAFNKANTNADDIVILQGVNTTQNNRISNVSVYANSAFDAANTALSDITIIQGVDATQNTEITNTTNHAIAAFDTANSATSNTIFTQGVDDTQNTNITNVETFTQSAFDTANTNSNNIIIIEGVNVSQNTEITNLGNTLSSAYDVANSASSNTIFTQGIDDAQNTFITGLNSYTAAAFDKANTGGVFTETVTINKDLYVSGNIIFSGNATAISANDIIIDDPLIYIANNNPSNLLDIGIIGNFTTDYYQHTGIVRDATDGKWKLFSNVVTEPTTTVDFTNAIYDTIKVGSVESTSAAINTHSNITSTSHTTSSTSEVTIDSFSAASYRSVKYEVQITSGTSYHVIELRVLHDDVSVWLTQYGEMFTAGSLGLFDASITSGTLNLLFTPVNATTTIKLVRSAITL